MRSRFLLAAAVALIASPSLALDLAVTVKGDDGLPLANAVVVVRPASGAAAGQPIRFAWPLKMTQQNIAFDPYVLIVPVGSTVGFPNKDKVRHHVYSFSATKSFELKLYGQQEERTVTFDKAGVAPLGCNIHDSMIGYIFVTDSAFSAKSDASGQVLIRSIPAGAASVSVWHPDMKARAPMSTPMAASGRQVVVLPLRPPATRHKH